MPRRSQAPPGKHLTHRVTTKVRFCEVDALQIVWHGHYLKYFEDAREEFGRFFGIRYCDILNAGLLAPIVSASCEYLEPAKMDDNLEIIAQLFHRDSAKLEFFYEVRRQKDSTLLAAGQTTQAFTDLHGDLLLTLPPFMMNFYRRWENQMRDAQ